MIADTSFIIDIMERVPEALKKAQELEDRQEKILITTITVFELWIGITKSSKPEHEKKKVEEILQSQFIVDLDKESAQEAGKINGLLQLEGNIIDSEDCLIAGIAHHHGEMVVTKNVKHFRRIKSLSVETY